MKAFIQYGAILILLCSKTGSAHTNAELQMDEEGYIHGAPDYVQPIRFDLVNRRFQVKNLELIIPGCLNRYFVGSIQKISGTWFHHQTTVPPHVVFAWSVAGSDVIYHVPFSLISAKPMYVVETKSLDQTMDEGRKIEIDQSCQKAIDQSINETNL